MVLQGRDASRDRRMKRFYTWNDQPVTAAEFGELVADLFSRGYTLVRKDCVGCRCCDGGQQGGFHVA